jgi:lipid-A-disaccharide synthase
MPNIIAGREVSPELLQSEFTPERVAAELEKILDEGEAREKMLAGLAEVREKLRPEIHSHLQGATAVERAADAVLKTLPQSGTR